MDSEVANVTSPGRGTAHGSKSTAEGSTVDAVRFLGALHTVASRINQWYEGTSGRALQKARPNKASPSAGKSSHLHLYKTVDNFPASFAGRGMNCYQPQCWTGG